MRDYDGFKKRGREKVVTLGFTGVETRVWKNATVQIYI